MKVGARGAADRWLDRVVTRERVQRFSIAILAVNVALYVLVVAAGRFPFDARGTIILPDFMAHLTGGALFAGGRAGELYDVSAQAAFQAGITGDAKVVDVFISPPLVSVLYAPFATFSYGGGAAAWTTISLGLILASLLLLRRLAPSLSSSERRVFLLAFAASQPVIQILGSGQDTGISLLLWASGTYLALRRRDAAAGLVFGLGLFKPQLFLLPPLVFLLLRRWRSVAAWGACSLGVGLLTLLVFGTTGVHAWWQLLHSPQYLVSLRAGRALRMASVVPLMLSIAPDSMSATAEVVGNVLSAGLALATLARISPRRVGGALDERSVWALACVATLLVTPHLFYYDLALLALPAALMLDVSGEYSAVARDSFLALALLTWTGALRIPLESAGWPARLLAASWTAVPMFVLWREIARAPPRASSGTRASLRLAS